MRLSLRPVLRLFFPADDGAVNQDVPNSLRDDPSVCTGRMG